MNSAEELELDLRMAAAERCLDVEKASLDPTAHCTDPTAHCTDKEAHS